jgi:hypothetical protein
MPYEIPQPIVEGGWKTGVDRGVRCYICKKVLNALGSVPECCAGHTEVLWRI